MAWATVASVAATVIGSSISSSGARSAASQQSDATDRAEAEQRRQYEQSREDYAPYRAAGTRALGQLETDINAPVTSADVMSDPGYKFGLEQGQLAIDRKTAAAGGRISGAALKAASQYGTNYAASGYGAAYQRRQDRLNRLSALAGIGQTATNGVAQVGQNSTNSIANARMMQGDASGAASMAQANIWANGTNQLGSIGQRWASQPSQQPTQPASFGGALDGFFKGNGGSGD